MRQIWVLVFSAALAAIGMPGGEARAQATQGRMIVGYPPGQSVDVIGRLLAERLGDVLGQRFIVENVPGQGGSIALKAVARMSPTDNVITLSASAALAGNPFLYGNIGYDPIEDFAPIGLLYDAPLLLLVNAELPVRNIEELLAYVRANADKITYSSPGNGSVSHLSMEEFSRRSGFKLVHAPYQGSAKSLTDLSSGSVQMTFDTIGASQPFLKAGKIRAIAVSSADRVDLFPELPTVAESGFPGFDLVPWVGALTVRGTSKDTIDRISAEMANLVKSQSFADRMRALGARPRTATPEQFASFLKIEVERWKKIVQQSGAKVN